MTNHNWMFSNLFITRKIDRLVSSVRRTNYTWNVLKHLHRQLFYEVDTYDNIDPLDVHWVDPKSIIHITGRQWKPWENRSEHLGSVLSGDWDKNPIPDAPSYYPREYAEYAYHKSVINHYECGIPWEDTEIYSVRRDRGIPHSQAIDTLLRTDELYGIIQRNGYMSQKELYLNYKGEASVYSSLLNEVLVDIGRDGEYLFVDGRHRLSLAKYMNLPKIPVVVLVRHAKYVG